MDWSNWVSLAVGLGLGVGSTWLSDRLRRRLFAPADATPDTPTLSQPQQETQLAYQMASQISQFKGGFLARVSHELRSPLNGIIGAHQLILADLCDDPAEEREFVAKAHASALKMVDMIDDILKVARIEHGKQRINLEPIQLAEIFEEVYRLTHLQAADRNLRLQIDPPDAAMYVRADRPRLLQVLVNLTDTALANMKEGSIRISVATFPLSPEDGGGDVCCHIWIDVPSPTFTWSEPVDLLQQVPVAQGRQINENPQLSSGMILLMDCRLLELMRGRLEILEIVPVPAAGSEFVRLQCTLPVAIRSPAPGSPAADCTAPSS
ncbi:sensor histidine kinase [Kamptonema formosum]|uniref:sensor histidine kinase n=1 Tax=Kamptonema formosum TaxID=331992 RepID=UPI00037B18C1|nr:HAMP domain-containing sensor histidine kinase [Oscillatoria sp. PCC 10802]